MEFVKHAQGFELPFGSPVSSHSKAMAMAPPPSAVKGEGEAGAAAEAGMGALSTRPLTLVPA